MRQRQPKLVEAFHPTLAERKRREKPRNESVRRWEEDDKMHGMIFRAMRLLIAINTWRYGKGASREVLCDLQGELAARG
jgi:hypothetical protein